MPFKLANPIVRDFILKRTDELFTNVGEATKISVKQASQLASERRSLILSKNTRIFDDNVAEIRLRSDWSMEELKRIEVYYTLVDSNIQTPEGKPLFNFKTTNEVPELAMSIGEFERAWGQLPTSVATEIYEYVLEVNRDWAHPLIM